MTDLEPVLAGEGRGVLVDDDGFSRYVRTWKPGAEAIHAGGATEYSGVLDAVTTFAQSCRDDPAPTTGAPVDFNWAEGCRCYLREDPEYGDLLTRPPGGCPVHSCNCLTFVYHGTHSSMCINTTLNTLGPGSP